MVWKFTKTTKTKGDHNKKRHHKDAMDGLIAVCVCLIRFGKRVQRVAKNAMCRLRRHTQGQLRAIAKKQLMTVFSFSAVTLAVMINGISSPAAAMNHNLTLTQNVPGIAVAQTEVTVSGAEKMRMAPQQTSAVLPSPDVYVATLHIGTETPYTVFAGSHRTVGEILQRAGVSVGENDRVIPSVDETLCADTDIYVIRVTFEQEVRDEVLPYQIQYTDVQYIPRGENKVTRSGVDGWHKAVVEKRYENGVLTDERIVSQEIVREPVDQLVTRGVGGQIVGADGNTYNYSYYIDVMATAYGSYNTRTATGKIPQENYIAVDPSVIDLGSAVYVEGESLKAYDGLYYAEDTGGLILGNRIDIYMGSLYDNAKYEEMIQFGVRDMRVYILE